MKYEAQDNRGWIVGQAETLDGLHNNLVKTHANFEHAFECPMIVRISWVQDGSEKEMIVSETNDFTKKVDAEIRSAEIQYLNTIGDYHE